MADPQHVMPVLPPHLVVDDFEQIHKRFLDFTYRVRRQYLAPHEAMALGYDKKRIVDQLAKTCHERRLRQAGLSRVPEKERNELIALVRIGGRLVGPTTLHEERSWMSEVTTFLMHHMRSYVRAGGVGLHLPPIILAGPPGVGKSWFARSIATAVSLPNRVIDVGAGTAAFRIAGTEKGWSSVQSGLPVETMLQTHVANPLMVVDEIDKAGTIYSNNGNSSSLTTALLGLLDPGSAPRFECPGLRVQFDMSRVIWVLTANDADRIPAPLRDRCRVFHMPELTAEMALAFFDRIARDICGADGLKATARTFVAYRVASGKISLRQIARLIETLRSSDDGEPLH
ncbi:AAA family ATPase [Roseovarius sp. Pro17]|uniref:AAA family ATPase n=1 Tax=Roseovarius sp. Pro17 TaxID=3108175 RepID=UPI002D76FB95|nr:AAA family ATPase [Roseovarius sp. Pro17]